MDPWGGEGGARGEEAFPSLLDFTWQYAKDYNELWS